VLFVNNYPLDDAERECDRGALPRHHLWGLDGLREAGHEILVPSPHERAWLRRLSRRTHFQLGDLSKQMALWPAFRRERIDAVVCAEMGSMRALGLLRATGVLRTPLVGVLHPAPPSSVFSRRSVQGFDRVLCLGTAIAEGVGPLRGGRSAETVGWGADVSFPGYAQQEGVQVVSSGRTNRDFAVLAAACHRVNAPLLINGDAPIGGVAPAAVRAKPRTNEATYADLRSASIVAIPLARPTGCFGITELNDALGCGKPVVMTRNPYIDVDIEAVGCGRWVELGDTSGWATAISELLADQGLRGTMGDRGRQFAERSWNYEHFRAALLRAVDEVVGTRGSRSGASSRGTGSGGT
jgi:glycosyltransferase involved in cell wall biosynthesis